MISTKILEGIVVSDKADKTIVVTVSSRSKTKFKGKKSKYIRNWNTQGRLFKAVNFKF